MRLELTTLSGIVFKTIAYTNSANLVLGESRLELETLGHEPIVIPISPLLFIRDKIHMNISYIKKKCRLAIYLEEYIYIYVVYDSVYLPI